MARLSRIQEETRRRIDALDRSGLPPRKLGEQILDAIDLSVPSDGARLFGIDPATLLINRLLAATASDGAARIEWLLDVYLSTPLLKQGQLPWLMRARVVAAALIEDVSSSWGFPDSVLREQDPATWRRAIHETSTPVGGVIFVSLADHGRWVAAIGLSRHDRRRPFRAGEVAFLRLLAPSMGRAIASSLEREQALRSSASGELTPGILVLDRRRRIQFSNVTGVSWINVLRAAEPACPPGLPAAVWSVSSALLSGTDHGLARALVASTGEGPLRLEASYGTDDESISVLISPIREPALPSIPDTWPLTVAERGVTMLAIAGLHNTQIAARLSLSPYTVQTHLRHTYEKLGVHDRGSLLRVLFHATQLPVLLAAPEFQDDDLEAGE